jgi:hypothetical protein
MVQSSGRLPHIFQFHLLYLSTDFQYKWAWNAFLIRPIAWIRKKQVPLSAHCATTYPVTRTSASATLTEVFPCFCLSCKANARVKPAKTGHGQHSSKFVNCVVLFVIRIVLLVVVLFYVIFLCKCVLYHCHRVSTQLQLTNISYHITSVLRYACYY